MKKSMIERLSDPKYIRKLVRKQKHFNFRVILLAAAFTVYAVKTENRLSALELQVDRMNKEIDAKERES